jgi:acyl-CoA thioester hydrolase
MLKNRTSYRVIYGDTDQMGVTYYANYLRWFEIGRTELMRQAGMPYAAVEEDGLFFPVIEVHCSYRHPARFDDLVHIDTIVGALERASLRFDYTVFRAGDSQLLATGWTRHACVNRSGRPTRLPDAYARLLHGK